MGFDAKAFAGRTTWIFDVDYTLYGPEAALFEQVVPRITAFVANHLGLGPDDARAVQRDYYLKYGSTMRGMHLHHDVSPTPLPTLSMILIIRCCNPPQVCGTKLLPCLAKN